ncbi:MAG: glycosyl hydrolase [Pseudomonadota bacterium]
MSIAPSARARIFPRAQEGRMGACLLITLLMAGCGGGGGGATAPVAPDPEPIDVGDTQAPIVTVQGVSPAVHEQGTDYVDAGATATDDVDGTVAVTVTGTVVTAEAGAYTLTYNATDSAGNTGSATRTVVVADTTAPIITLNGATNVSQPQGTAYVDAGAEAQDAIDGAVAVERSGEVDVDVPGVYELIFTARDAVGNTSTSARMVTVVPAEEGAGDLLVLDGGVVGPVWSRGISAFDEAIGFAECNNDGGAGCPSIDWRVVADSERGDVLEIAHAASGAFAGVFISTDGVVDLSDYAEGSLRFDVKVISGDSALTVKLDCNFPCTSGDQLLGSRGEAGWETVTIALADLVAGGLDLTRVNTGIVIWATGTRSTVFRVDDVRFTGIADGATPPTEPPPGDLPAGAMILPFGAGSVSDTVNPASYLCVFDFGNFIFNAGVVLPAIAGCDTGTQTPIGDPTPLFPQLTDAAAEQPTMTHRWWGSVSFLGEMTTGDPNDAAYITPDPISARVSDRGVRLAGIPSGLRVQGNDFLYPIPDPFAEVFDGIAVGNTEFSSLEAFLKDFSDGSATVQWQDSEGAAVMEATFVHGSPYVYLRAFAGDFVVRTLRGDGGEKGTFYQQGDSLGVWTNVAGNYNAFLITGDAGTSFSNVSGNEIGVSSPTREMTVTYLPALGGVPAQSLTQFFEGFARRVVDGVDITYAVDRADNSVAVTHRYRDAAGAPVETLAGLQPLHWKRSTQATTPYEVRSARGLTRFAQTAQFTYTMPYVGALPALPLLDDSLDPQVLRSLVDAFIAQGEAAWNPRTDTYFTGKNYGKVASLMTLADQAGLTEQATRLREWLKRELADWFTADDNGSLDVQKYFVFDDDWNTLLGFEESFASHQQLNDHHFHYGYFVRAAAAICRTEPAWCGDDRYGPVVELLIRDYAGGRDDPMFPYLRHFDPANGFSWASGAVNFARGNNNESTSEAASAYGAMVLYGLVTGDGGLAERGMYLHASTAATYWEYWNNIDGYNAPGADADNFPPAYDRIATSIVWGDGAVFSTFFSGAFAQILGIQTLPTSPLLLHLGIFPDYLRDYVALGLTESGNGRPSGLAPGQWPDIWWAVQALVDAEAAIADYYSVPSYTPEEGETRAHTYHWLRTLDALGQVQTGTGALTANYPAALAFEDVGVTTYVVYNFDDEARTVVYSDGQIVQAAPSGFTVVRN